MLFKQASLVSELKSWCLSKLQNMEGRFTADPSGSRLKRSSSVTEGLNEAEGTGLTAVPADNSDSSNIPGCTGGEPSGAEASSANHYFVVHVESPSGKHTKGISTNFSSFTILSFHHVFFSYTNCLGHTLFSDRFYSQIQFYK